MSDNKWKDANGKAYYCPTRKEFIQVRESYFHLDKHSDDYHPETGHWAEYLGDAKNNVPFENQVTVRELKRMIDIEEVGLRNIPCLIYQNHNHEWIAKEKAKDFCPNCGHYLGRARR